MIHPRTIPDDVYLQEIPQGNRRFLAQAITLIESSRKDDYQKGRTILKQLYPLTGHSYRIGITGVPGVGKSTFIEHFGLFLIQQGLKVAVLAVDPSSTQTKGSILGDKTRMQQLAAHQDSFIRPTPSSGTLGGVAQRTRETMLLCEAAGYQVILIETVGVGQSETIVRSMVDFFLLLMLAGAGDELQGIKKGIMELADGIVITKADGDNLIRANIAKQELETALHYSSKSKLEWTTSVLLSSALQKQGLAEIWQLLLQFQNKMKANGFWDKQRKQQYQNWFQEYLWFELQRRFWELPAIQAGLSEVKKNLEEAKRIPTDLADELLDQLNW